MPGFEPVERVIAGKKFTVAPLDFRKGKQGLMKLLAVVAPAVGDALARGVSITALLGDSRIAAMLGDALSGLPSRLDDATMSWFENEFGAKSMTEIGDLNVAVKLDTDANRAMAFEALGYMAFFQWLGLCLEVNYAGFFGAALAGLGKKKPVAAEASATK